MVRCESPPKGFDRAIFSEMHWRRAEARSEGGRSNRERDGKERGQQLVNVADHLGISQGIQSLLFNLSQVRFSQAVPNTVLLLEQRNHTACLIYRNEINFQDLSWELD